MKQMLPCSAAADVPDIRLLGIEAFSDVWIGHAFRAQPSNLNYVVVGQFSPMRFGAEVMRWSLQYPKRMQNVFRLRHIFQITFGIVRWIPIFVIHHVAGRTFSDKSQSDKTMDRLMFLSSTFRQRHAHIAIPRALRLQDSEGALANASCIADFIQFLVAGDGLPCLIHPPIVTRYNMASTG